KGDRGPIWVGFLASFYKDFGLQCHWPVEGHLHQFDGTPPSLPSVIIHCREMPIWRDYGSNGGRAGRNGGRRSEGWRFGFCSAHASSTS
ncbi:hypothetical protein NEUTE1DRAFT_56089, partial [Neurospora tetrasperma FGSC 2508]